MKKIHVNICTSQSNKSIFKKDGGGTVWLTTKDHPVTMKTVVCVCVCVCVCVEKGSSFRHQHDTGYYNVDAETMRQIIKADFVIRD